MAAKAWSSQQKAVEEVLFQNEAVSLRLLINRRTRTMRVVDFRAGATPGKRHAVLEQARREGVEKVFTLVERDEVATWVKLGFTKEGSIPGFYKRSDAWLLGCQVRDAREPARDVPPESEIRIALRGRLAHTLPIAPLAPVADDDAVDDDAKEIDLAHARAEKTLVHAKKRAKELASKPLPRGVVTRVDEGDVRRSLDRALKGGVALTAFEPFGRDVERRYFTVAAKGYEGVASAELQSCFGNAFLELLTGPARDTETAPVAGCVKALCDKLLAEEVVSVFTLGPSDDVRLATALVANGFRRTGLLEGHIVVGSERKDAIIWSRKLANPADD